VRRSESQLTESDKRSSLLRSSEIGAVRQEVTQVRRSESQLEGSLL
jgi:hypothetical protein